MKASAHAEVAPNSSKTTPRSHVRRERVRADTTRVVVNIKCRFG